MAIAKPSATAEIMAFHRATEMTRPEDERVCQDPYAGLFLPEEYAALLKDPLVLNAMGAENARKFPGVNGAVVARTRFIDDVVLDDVKKGLPQLVILGAGFDSRAHRIDGIERSTRVFEVDQPLTQEKKIQKIVDTFGGKPSHVHYVAIDLFNDDLKTALLNAGYDSSGKTLFIMEGLTFYLPAAAFDRILAFIARDSGLGSEVVFDYLPPSVIDGISDRTEARNSRIDLQQYGEPYRLGFDRDKLESMLGERGFDLIENVNARDCKDKYFFGRSRDREVTPMFRFAHAIVRK